MPERTTSNLKRESAGRYRTTDGRFGVEQASGGWMVVDGEQTNELGLALVRGPFGSLDEARAAIEEARSGPPPTSNLAARIAALPRPKSASRTKPAPLPPEPPPLKIRELRRADGEALRQLWDAGGFRSVGDDDASLATFARRNPGLLLVATAGETIIASALGAWDGRRGWIYHVTTAAGHRRAGVGRQLVTQIEERLVALGCPRVNVVVRDEDEAAPAFWRALGYSVTLSRHYGKDLAPLSGHDPDTGPA